MLLLFYMFNGLAKVIEAMHGLSQPVQFGVVLVTAFIAFCALMAVIFH